MPIKKRLSFVLILIMLLPTLFIGAFSYFYVDGQLTAQARQTTSSITQSCRETMESMLEEQEVVLEPLANSMLVNNILDASKERLISTDDPEYQLLYPLLVKKASKSFLCQSLTVYNDECRAVASSDLAHFGVRHQSLADFTYEEGEPVITSKLIRPDSGDDYFIDIILPYYRDSKLKGYVTSTIDTSYFKGMMSASQLSYDCDVMLTDLEGSILYHTNEQYIHSTLDARINERLWDSWRKSKEGSLSLPYHGSDCIFAYSTIKGLNWVVLTQRKMDSAQAISRAILIAMASSLVLTVAFCVIFGIYCVNRLYRPLDDLNEGLRQLTSGSFDIAFKGGQGEFGETAKQLNKVAEILREAQKEILSAKEQVAKAERRAHPGKEDKEFPAEHDPLTGLANRLSFSEKTDAMFQGERSQGMVHAVLALCVENLGSVRESLGSDYGDALLKLCAQKLREFLPSEYDCVSRAGDEEFLLLQHDTTRARAAKLAEDILKSFGEPFLLRDDWVYATLSIGISLYPEQGLTQARLSREAQAAMRHAGESGKMRYCFFDASMGAEEHLAEDILDALRNGALGWGGGASSGIGKGGGLFLMYQPLLDASTRKIIGFEAHPYLRGDSLGILPPPEWIPIAERNGMMDDLGIWSLRETCALAQSLVAASGPLRAMVGLSPSSLASPVFAGELRAILHEAFLDPSRLWIGVPGSFLTSLDEEGAGAAEASGAREGVGILGADEADASGARAEAGTSGADGADIDEAWAGAADADRAWAGASEDGGQEASAASFLRQMEDLGVGIVLHGIGDRRSWEKVLSVLRAAGGLPSCAIRIGMPLLDEVMRDRDGIASGLSGGRDGSRQGEDGAESALQGILREAKLLGLEILADSEEAMEVLEGAAALAWEGPGREASGQEASRREASGKEASGQEASRREASGKEASRQDASRQEASRQDVSGREKMRPGQEGSRAVRGYLLRKQFLPRTLESLLDTPFHIGEGRGA